MPKNPAQKTKKYRSKISRAVHEGMSGMYRLGLIDKETMREFDVGCLTPAYQPKRR